MNGRSPDAADLVFLDTETCGLGLRDDIWEIAAVRRFADGRPEETFHAFVGHLGCEHLPGFFRRDHEARWPEGLDHVTGGTWNAQTGAFRHLLRRADDGSRPHLVGAVPDFDAYRLRLQGFVPDEDDPPWHHHLIDVEALVVGWLNANEQWEQRAGWKKRPPLEPPWESEHLSIALDIDPEDFERHSAMGDVRWVMALYDRVMGLS